MRQHRASVRLSSTLVLWAIVLSFASLSDAARDQDQYFSLSSGSPNSNPSASSGGASLNSAINALSSASSSSPSSNSGSPSSSSSSSPSSSSSGSSTAPASSSSASSSSSSSQSGMGKNKLPAPRTVDALFTGVGILQPPPPPIRPLPKKGPKGQMNIIHNVNRMHYLQNLPSAPTPTPPPQAAPAPVDEDSEKAAQRLAAAQAQRNKQMADMKARESKIKADTEEYNKKLNQEEAAKAPDKASEQRNKADRQVQQNQAEADAKAHIQEQATKTQQKNQQEKMQEQTQKLQAQQLQQQQEQHFKEEQQMKQNAVNEQRAKDEQSTRKSLQAINFRNFYVNAPPQSIARVLNIQSYGFQRAWSTFQMVPALSIAQQGYVSMQSIVDSRFFACCNPNSQFWDVYMRQNDGSQDFKDLCSFHLVGALSTRGPAGAVSFQSYRDNNRFLRHSGFVLHCWPNDNSDLFAQDATFTIDDRLY